MTYDLWNKFRIKLMVWESDSSKSELLVGLGECMTIYKGRNMSGLGEGVCSEECVVD